MRPTVVAWSAGSWLGFPVGGVISLHLQRYFGQDRRVRSITSSGLTSVFVETVDHELSKAFAFYGEIIGLG